jgi:hypothetical protein
MGAGPAAFSDEEDRMTTTTVRRSTGALGACLAAITLLAGCGAQDSANPSAWQDPGKAVIDIAREAPDATKATGSARYEMTLTDTTSGSGYFDGTFTTTASGTYDFARQIGDGEYTYSGDVEWMQLSPEEVVFTNNVLYQRDIGADRWEQLDFSSLVNTPVGQHDPSQQLDLLRGVSEDVREVGTTQVRDTEVRQFAITIDPQRLAQEQGVVVEGGIVEAALRAARPMPGQVFVDADGRVRRLEVRVESVGSDIAAMPELGDLLGGDTSGIQEQLQERRTTMEVRIDYFDFGVPVTAQVPDPSLVDPWTPDLPDLSEIPGLPDLGPGN